MAQRAVTPRGSENYPALNLPNPNPSGHGANVFDNAPWLADATPYITGDAPIVFEASQSRQPGLAGYMPEPTLPAGNVYRHIPYSPLGDQMTDVGATKVGAPYTNNLDNEIPAGLANAPWHYSMGFDSAPNSQTYFSNNDHALVSPLGYTNPAVAPGVLVQNTIAGPAGGVGHGGLAIPVVLGGNTIG